MNARTLILPLLMLVCIACGPKKNVAIDPPTETPEPAVEPQEQPETPEPPPAPAPAPPKPRRADPDLASPPVQPRAPAKGDLASIKIVEKGIIEMNAGRLDDAEQLFEQALRISPSNGKPYYYLGVIASKQGNPDRALGFLDQAEIYLYGDNFWMSQVHLQQGLILKQTKQHEAAKRKFQKALEEDPTNRWAERELRSLP